jgi:hypothetical protein
MPDVSRSQQRLMQGIKHGWVPDRIKNPPSKKVASDFVAADKAAGPRKLPDRKQKAPFSGRAKPKAG